MNITVVTHHFSPEINGTAVRVSDTIKKLCSSQKTMKTTFFVVAPAPSRPFGAYKRARYLYEKRIDSSKSVILFRIWNFQPISENPPHFQRMLNYTIFPFLGLPILIYLILLSKVVIVVSPPTPLLIAALIAKLLRKKVIVDITDLWHREARDLGYIKDGSILLSISKALERLSLQSADWIWTATRWIKNFLSMTYPQIEHKLKVLPTPIDKGTFRPIYFRKKPHIIYAGNFGKPQALEIAIEAMAVIRKYQPRLKLVLIGGGETKKELESLVRELELNDNVTIREPIRREELPKEYSESLMGLVPLAFKKSLEYAVPTKLYEYLSCGLPFISYGSSKELKRLVEISKAGIHADCPKEVSQVILNSCTDSKTLKKMRNYGIKFIKDLDEQIDAAFAIF